MNYQLKDFRELDHDMLQFPVLSLPQERKEGKEGGRAQRQEMNTKNKGQKEDKPINRTGGLFLI